MKSSESCTYKIKCMKIRAIDAEYDVGAYQANISIVQKH